MDKRDLSTGELVFEPFPDDFPNKDRFIAWDRSWSRIGYRDTPQYPGAQPIRYPEDASLVEIQYGGYLRPTPSRDQAGVK